MITQMSVSQAETFDHAQKGGCQRKWWFERPMGLKPEQGIGQSDGDKGHALLAHYGYTGELPAKRAKMGKHVTGVILKGDLPKPGTDLLIEERFSGQSKLDEHGNWIPLDETKTFWLAGLPWDGFIDVAHRRTAIPEVRDYKFSSDIDANAKKPEELIKTIQMPVYVLNLLRRWPDAEWWRLIHHNISRSGVHSFLRETTVHIDDVLERKPAIEAIVAQMGEVAQLTEQDAVPFNRKSCDTWWGCPHQSLCNAFRRNQVNIDPEDAALFNEELDGVTVEAAPVPAAPSPLQVEDTKAAQKAKLLAELAALDAPPAPPAKVRKLTINDQTEPVAPAAAPAVPAAPAPKCGGCGVTLSPANGSKLSSGLWKHIGCPKDAPAPVLPPDAPASNPALASEKPAEPKPEKKPKAATQSATPPPAQTSAAPSVALPPTLAAGIPITLELGPKTIGLIERVLAAISQ